MDELRDRIVGLERAVWDALVRGDADADERLLSDDFLGVYPIGFADRSEHAGQLRGGPTVSSYEIDDVVVREVATGHALLTYAATYRRPGSDHDERMYVSSLWSQVGGEWRNVFSQDTPATG